MARRRRRSSAMVVRQISPSYGAPRTAAPIVIRQSAPATRHKRRSHFRGRGKTKGMGLNQTIMGAAVAGGLIGLAEKTGLLDKLPTIPIVGRKGALAIAAYFWAKHGGGQMARDVAIAAATMSAYQLGKEGTISGDDY